MSEIQRYEREVFMLRADKKRMNLEIGDFDQRQQSFEGTGFQLICIDYKRIIDQHKREIEQMRETSQKLHVTIHDVTISYEGQKKENANLKSIKCNLEADKAQLEKDRNEMNRSLVSLKAHSLDQEHQLKVIRKLLDGRVTVKQSLDTLGNYY
jgi:multidrug resistance efflux pump